MVLVGGPDVELEPVVLKGGNGNLDDGGCSLSSTDEDEVRLGGDGNGRGCSVVGWKVLAK